MQQPIDYGIMMAMTDREEQLLDLIRQAESSLLGFTYNKLPLHPDVEKAVLQIQTTVQTLLDNKLDKQRASCVKQDIPGFIASNN